MKWLPKSKKSLLLLLPVLILGAGLAYFIMWTAKKNDDSLNKNANSAQVKEVKTDDILLALKDNPSLSELNLFLGATDFNARLVPNAVRVLQS